MTAAVDPLGRALKVGTPVFIAYIAVATAAGHFWASSWGSFGALLGALVPFVFFGITLVTGVLARRLSPQYLGFAILGSWLPKMLLLLVFLAWLRHQTWFDRPTFMVALLIGSALLLGIEGWVAVRTPTFYVEPGERGAGK